MMIVNAYFVYRYEYKETHQGSTEGMRKLINFAGRLAYKLIYNIYLPVQQVPVVDKGLIQVLYYNKRNNGFTNNAIKSIV